MRVISSLREKKIENENAKFNFIKKILTMILKIFLQFGTYLPIIFGILAPMALVILPYAFWSIMNGFKMYRGTWLEGYINLSRDHVALIPSNLFIVLEIIIFFVGLSLFVLSFVQLVRSLIKEKALIQSGLYKYIRHPQNLAIIIMALPFTLYVPGFNDIGIRLGDIVSWIQFIVFMVIYSHIGDLQLKKKFPEQFDAYYHSTGFMFPKIRSKSKQHRITVFSHKWILFGIYLIVCVGFILTLYVLSMWMDLIYFF